MTDLINPLHYCYFDEAQALVGRLLLAGNHNGLQVLSFVGENANKHYGPKPGWIYNPSAFSNTSGQLREYFAGKRKHFDIKLNAQGTPFQKQVWDLLTQIPYGETVSYSVIAEAVNKPKAQRAVGMANSSNPISIIVPCHRVIGKRGQLTGFGGGMDAKQALLNLEQDTLGPLGFALKSVA